MINKAFFKDYNLSDIVAERRILMKAYPQLKIAFLVVFVLEDCKSLSGKKWIISCVHSQQTLDP